MTSRSNRTIDARAARHPVYRHRAVFWGEVHDGGKLVYGIGPFRRKTEALDAARLWSNQHQLPGVAGAGPAQIQSVPLPEAPQQKPCNIGLFDDAGQRDLLDLMK